MRGGDRVANLPIYLLVGLRLGMYGVPRVHWYSLIGLATCGPYQKVCNHSKKDRQSKI